MHLTFVFMINNKTQTLGATEGLSFTVTVVAIFITNQTHLAPALKEPENNDRSARHVTVSPQSLTTSASLRQTFANSISIFNNHKTLLHR